MPAMRFTKERMQPLTHVPHKGETQFRSRELVPRYERRLKLVGSVNLRSLCAIRDEMRLGGVRWGCD